MAFHCGAISRFCSGKRITWFLDTFESSLCQRTGKSADVADS